MKPLLSIGIIFKNEIRCLERCVKSLQPLRDAIPCELVMADTGSDDGSREIAEKYADILFDFPWINDFAAARNAVMDRCSGEWFFTMDADEWLDTYISQLLGFLTNQALWVDPFCGVIVRNYFTPELDDERADFVAARIVRLSTGIRYEGAIHEVWDRSGDVYVLNRIMLHHDGYMDSVKAQKNKYERNMQPLLEKLAQDPEDLRTLTQCIESEHGGTSYDSYLRRAVAVVEKHPLEQKCYGPPVLRYAILWAAAQDLPELEKWSAEALEWFPDSIFINIDAAYSLFVYYAQKQDHARAIPIGERYLSSLAKYREGKFDYKELAFNSLVMTARSREDGIRVVLADQYFHEKQFVKAKELLLSIDRSQIQPGTAKDYMGVLLNLQAQSGEDLSWVMTDLWERIGQSPKREKLRTDVLHASAIAFSTDHRRAETENGHTRAYAIFLPLAGKCGLGTAAAILESSDLAEMERLLRTVDNWDELPIVALERALLAGVKFPQADRPLMLEQMDCLASRLAQSGEYLTELLDVAVRSMGNGPQALFWARGLALVAIGANKWEDEVEGFRLAKTFAEVERAVLPQYYAADMLQDEAMSLLPPMHRFGWYCVQAFDALDSGDLTGYVCHLREGLSACESMKPMVEFLTEHTPQLQAPKLSDELLTLAEKVRMLLSAYDPNDPAVAALKASPAYQKVAYLIEGADGGGLPS